MGSLFAGIGGLDLGLERAGMRVRWQVEIDDYCNRVLEKHWPGVKRYGDIKQINWSEVEPVDLICGGFPCQPVSCAGNQKGDSDERWLWPEFIRAIREVRPKYALVENVPGLLSTDDGRLARRVFGDLAEIGYDAEWGIVSAASVGAPHLRQRVFIVAHPEGIRMRRRGNGRSRWEVSNRPIENGSDVPDPECDLRGSSWHERPFAFDWGRSSMADPDQGGLPEAGTELEATGIAGDRTRRISDWWAVEPGLGRVADGVPNRVDRLKCLGNAVVPQVAEVVGRFILEIENQEGGTDG